MGLDLWFRQDVARILASTWQTMQVTAEGTRSATEGRSENGMVTLDDRAAGAYLQGFEDALRAVGVAFGLVGVPPAQGRSGRLPLPGDAAGSSGTGGTPPFEPAG